MDQATSLRAKFNDLPQSSTPNKRSTKSISITSGKGGVGKTSFSVNFSYELARQGFKILLADCDFGLANVDIMLNIRGLRKTIEEVLKSNIDIEQAIINLKDNFDVLPASSGMTEIADMDIETQKKFIKSIIKIQDKYDFLIFDTGAGIHKSVLRINAAADYVLVITNPEPTAITDAYSIMKTLRTQYKIQNFNIVVNQANYKQALEVKDLILNVASKNGIFYNLKLLGAIDNSPLVKEAIFKRSLWYDINKKAGCLKDLNNIMINFFSSDQAHQKNDTHAYDRLKFWKKWIINAKK